MQEEIKRFTVSDCLDFINDLLKKGYITKEDKMYVTIGDTIHPLVFENHQEPKDGKFKTDKINLGVISIGDDCFK